jgi:hypothetical protein
MNRLRIQHHLLVGSLWLDFVLHRGKTSMLSLGGDIYIYYIYIYIKARDHSQISIP